MNMFWIKKESRFIEKAFTFTKELVSPNLEQCMGHLGSTIKIKIMEKITDIYNSNSDITDRINAISILTELVNECNKNEDHILISSKLYAPNTHKNDSFKFFDDMNKKFIEIPACEIDPITINYSEYEKFINDGIDFEETYKLCYDLNILKKAFRLNCGLYKLYMKTTLKLNHKSLTLIPSEICVLQNLRTLDLSFNQLQSIPDSIGQLQNLQTLNLSNNKLQSLPDSIRQLQNLQILYLFNNKLQSLPDSIGQLHDLRVLRLCGNKLQSLPDSIGQLQNLKILVSDSINKNPENISELKAVTNPLITVSFNGTAIKNLDEAIDYYIGLPTKDEQTFNQFKKIIKLFCEL